MRFDPELADIRFGCGLSPVVEPPRSIEQMLAGLNGPDAMAQQFPIEPWSAFLTRMQAAQAIWKERRQVRGTPRADELRKDLNLLKKAAREGKARWMGQSLLRRAYTATGFRERLAFFWADHFTAYGKAGIVKRATAPYIDDAIRPNLTGRFADLLAACVTHPVMLHFLDQHTSMGPNSAKALRRAGKGGLNENLAREVLELHSLGVNGPYSQADVRELAELFTGMSFQASLGFKFRKDFTEPGPETVLGKTYTGRPGMRPILKVLEDLAAHPATAQHIAEKLCRHFVSDRPAPEHVAQVAARFLETDGDLAEVYAALLDHPAAWQPELTNAKLPVDFVGSALRGLAVPPDHIAALNEKSARRVFTEPMAKMGQVWQQPIGPDGWPEEDGHWFTPQGLSARIDWAMRGPQALMPQLPDPRVFVESALGSRATQEVRFAAAAAESRSDAIGLVLCAPAFQRR